MLTQGCFLLHANIKLVLPVFESPRNTTLHSRMLDDLSNLIPARGGVLRFLIRRQRFISNLLRWGFTEEERNTHCI